MKRVLILFASNHGQTRTIASALERGLGELGVDVVTRDARSAANELPALGGFDAVVLRSRRCRRCSSPAAWPRRTVGWKPRTAVAVEIARAAGHSTDTAHDHEYTRWDQVHALTPAILELAGTPRRASHAS